MILDFIINLGVTIFIFILDLINLPPVPQGLQDAVLLFVGLMRDGIRLFNFFCPLDKIAPALELFMTVFLVVHTYRLVMWILRKIPLLGIK